MHRLACLLTLLTLPACAERRTSTGAPADGASTPFSMSVLEITPCPLPPGIDGSRVRIVGVKVRLEGHHSRGVPANYFYASLLTTDQDRYLAEHPGCTPLLAGPPLAPGESAEGFLNFPVPIGKIADTLVYAAALGGQHEGASTIELPLAPPSSPADEDDP